MNHQSQDCGNDDDDDGDQDVEQHGIIDTRSGSTGNEEPARPWTASIGSRRETRLR
jgi:hypothetical protein